MTTTTRDPASITGSGQGARYRIAVDVAQRWLALLGVVLCALQIGFAALGFWGAQANRSSQSATRAAYEPHALDGQILQYLAVVLLILGVVARSGWSRGRGGRGGSSPSFSASCSSWCRDCWSVSALE